MRYIASYTGRSPQSIGRDLGRWEERGLAAGLADATPPGNPPRITEEARTFMEGKLSEKERTWNATQLAEALGQSCFGIELTPEAIRQHLHSMGYSCKRTRYVPNKSPDPEQERVRPGKSWRGLKRGGRGRDRPEVP